MDRGDNEAQIVLGVNPTVEITDISIGVMFKLFIYCTRLII
ncbi:hypothetical protein [Halobacillus trueperi]